MIAAKALTVEPIRVADIDFHVTKSIDQCPPHLQARELLMNAVEAEMLPEEAGVRIIKLYAVEVDGVPKFAIWNSGHGMTGEELVKSTDLASSIRKIQGLDGRKNRGEGAKVAALPWNHAGLRFRSCRKGAVNEAKLARVNGIYVRVREPVTNEQGVTVGMDPVWDVTAQSHDEGYRTDIDWTEVVCMGQTLGQDTTRWPYGPELGKGDRRTVLTEIFDRFYSLPNNVGLEADESLHGRKGSTTFRLMSDVVARWGADSSMLRSERVKAPDGVEIEFVHTPMLSGNNTVMGARELTGQPTRIALVWQGEMYGANIGADWRKIAAGFGLPQLHSVVSIFIHLPDDAEVRDGPYRADLRWKDTGEIVDVDEYQSVVRTLMPEWLKAMVIEALRPKRASDMSEVRQELERRLRKARVRPVDMGRLGNEEPEFPIAADNDSIKLEVKMSDADIDDVAGIEVESIAKKPRQKATSTILDPDVPPNKVDRPISDAPKKAQAPRRRSIQLVSTAPEIIWLDTEAQISGEDLIDRAGKYDRPTNRLFLNGLYQAVKEKIDLLETHLSQQVDWNSVRDVVVDRVRAEMALHVGSVVIYALAKQGLPTWTELQWQKALEPETLTVVADQSDHLLGDIRSALLRTSIFKVARVIA